MKSFVAMLILCCLMLGGVFWNEQHVNRTADALIERLDRLPDIDDEACVQEVQAFCDYWESKCNGIEFSAGFVTVDRISEYAVTLLACASCGDLYGYRTALALLHDAIEDMRRPEQLSFGTLF